MVIMCGGMNGELDLKPGQERIEVTIIEGPWMPIESLPGCEWIVELLAQSKG